MAERSAPVRASAPSNPVRARFDAFELDEANASLRRDGKPVDLAPTPFAVLCALVRQPGTLLTANALLDEVWGHQFVSDSVLRTAISELRTVLSDDARNPRFIQTVSRRGYRFIAATSAVAAAPPSDARISGIAAPEGRSFIGRGDALSRLRRAWDIACGGRRTVVWVAGEPGIGKTALIDHFVVGLGAVAYAHGQCVEHYGAGEPYLPVLEALAQLCRGDSTVPELLRAVAPAWLLQLPWLCTAEERDALRRDLSGVGPERMLRELGEVLDRYTERRPLLLVTEDLHWSDRATIELIDYIARRRTSARLMWLASFRLTEVVALDHPLNPVRHELRLHGLCEEIVLDPFSEAEVADYVAKCSASAARDEAFVHALHERTDGVPLFVASVMRDVTDRAARDMDDAAIGAHLADIAVPENLTAIIDHYIAKLGSAQREVLAAAAVCGVEFRVPTISEAIGRDATSVGEACDELAREQVWIAAPRPDDGGHAAELAYSFRHALFRQVLYERTGPAARARLHGLVGAALERERAAGLPVAAAELAMHFERGREPMIALRYYAEAAEDALAKYSPTECLALTERAFTLLDRTPRAGERNALELALATLRGISAAHARGISSAEAKSAFQRAYTLLADLPEHPMRGRLLHAFGFALCLRAEYAEALAVAKRAETLSSATHDAILLLSACTVHGHVHMLQGRPQAGRAWNERGLAVTESLDAAADQIFVAEPMVTLLGQLGIQLLHLGFIRQARARLQQAHARAQHVAQPMARMVALWFDAMFEVRLGNAERVRALAADMQGVVEAFALAQGRTACRWFRGWADARLGQPREGFRLIRDAYDENTRLGMLAGGSETLAYAAEAQLLAGDPDAARQQLDEALQITATHGERIYLAPLHLIEAAIDRARGAAGDAPIRRAIAEARTQGAPWLELLALLELCEYGRATAKDRQALASLVDRLPEADDTSAVTKAKALLAAKKRTERGAA
jgi:DNA-binding winged helix-turn-helix (wHTH) protein